MMSMEIEEWITSNFYCPACGNRLEASHPIRGASDLKCSLCNETFLLRSSAGRPESLILLSGYTHTLDLILASIYPSIIALQYDRARRAVQDLCVIHRLSIAAGLIIPRPPFSPTARHSGWRGCVLSLEGIPERERIAIISQGRVRDKGEALARWAEIESALKRDNRPLC